MNLFNCMKLNSLKYFCTIDVAALTLTILKVCFFFDNIQHFHSCLINFVLLDGSSLCSFIFYLTYVLGGKIQKA